jgi:hypothetical protein
MYGHHGDCSYAFPPSDAGDAAGVLDCAVAAAELPRAMLPASVLAERVK